MQFKSIKVSIENLYVDIVCPTNKPGRADKLNTEWYEISKV